MNSVLEEKLLNLPESPGVYIFKDKQNKIIYIGKAKLLKNRVKSYFNNSDDNRAFYHLIINNIETLDWLVTNTEQEAFILENSLIKQFKPKYNIELKDDKNFYSIRIQIKNSYPKLELVRNQKNDDAFYFGPFSDSTSVKKMLKHLNQVFKLRTCSDSELLSRTRPCILFQIGRCSAPCTNEISESNYQDSIKSCMDVLKGKTKELQDKLKEEMDIYAEELKFEKAAEIRDKIKALEKITENQLIVENEEIDKDVFAYYVKNDEIHIQGIFIRACMIRSYFYQKTKTFNQDAEDLFVGLLKLFYSKNNFYPRQILIPFENDETNMLQVYVEQLSGKKIKVMSPQKGKKAQLLDLALKNAMQNAETQLALEKETEIALTLIKEKLNLKNYPTIIECYDISNIQGHDSVASGVCFVDGKANKSKYKKYKIKTVEGTNDFASLNEVIYRRLKRGLVEHTLPSLLLIDGGEAQLNAANEALKLLGIENVDIVGIAKARQQKQSIDRFYILSNPEPIYLPENSLAKNILVQLRDEAHRFAITYHRKLRGKKFKEDPLRKIPGVGPIKRRSLMKYFGNINEIRHASIEEISKVNGITTDLATTIKHHLS